MRIILICGSRNASPRMLGLARAAVKRAEQLNWQIIVGDANGVDEEVIGHALCCTVYAAFGFARNSADRHEIVLVPGNYTARDNVMIAAADMVFCIWDGKSKGTARNYNRAVELGKQAWLMQ